MPRLVDCRARRRLLSVMVLLPIAAVLAAVFAAGVVGCGKKRITRPSTPPGPIFRGPDVFHGTVGSMARIPLDDMQPLLVSRYWVAVGLNGTGSRDVPRALRTRLLNELGLKGLGSVSKGTADLTPQRLLDHADTSVVLVEGLIPGGATRGDPFDLLVTSMQSLTTSLEGGRLLMDVELAPGGAAVRFAHSYAKASGQLYLNPLEDDLSRRERIERSRVAVVLSGGQVTRDRSITLLLNQSDSNRSRMIADRINERFGRNPDDGDKYETAVAQDESRIELHVPHRWRGQSARLLSLIVYCYVQRRFDFELEQAARLGKALEEDPDNFADRVALAWEALGPNAKPAISQYYDHPDLKVRFAALQAGSHMQDENTSKPLARLAKVADPAVRRRAAEMMVFLPDSLVASHALRTLLDDADRNVRIAAYQALSRMGNMDMIDRLVFKTAGGKLKFVLDMVNAKQPLVFISQTQLPRVVVFNSYTGLKTPVVASLWDNRLMIKAPEAEGPAEVYYQAPGKTEGEKVQMLPFIVHLVKYMARRPKLDKKGLDLSYSRVVNALYQLREAGYIDADLEVESSPLAEGIARYRQQVPDEPRPETDQDQPAPEESTPVSAPDDAADVAAGGRQS